MANTAQTVIKPGKSGVFRIVFIYTGQGESTLLVIPKGNEYIYVLVDSDEDKEKDEVNLVAMFKDLFADGGELSVFINTHPHKDHLTGIREIYDEIGVKEVWHSNHKPAGERHDSSYQELKYVLGKVGRQNVYHLKGSNSTSKLRQENGQGTEEDVIKRLGDIDYQVLSPASYVCDDIAGEDDAARNRRIHEHCAVIRFTYKDVSILITGDSDRKAWEEHITDYHKDSLPARVLSASHHGSRTFFKKDKDDTNPFEEHIKAIKPEWVIISAPKKDGGQFDHPHDDAMELYRKYVAEEKILHMGNDDGKPYSVVIDIDSNGKLDIRKDTQLIKAYPKPDTDKGIGEKSMNEAQAHRKNVLDAFKSYATPHRH